MEKLSWLAFIIFETEGSQIFNATKDNNSHHNEIKSFLNKCF